MKMLNAIDNKMIAICGMNCTTCYKHLITKNSKQCNVCKYDNETLPEHCRKCKIKDCTKSKNLQYCFECQEFPCKLINNLDKVYRQKYNTSLIENVFYIKENGTDKFLEQEKIKCTCSSCNGIISLHDRFCSECKEFID